MIRRVIKGTYSSQTSNNNNNNNNNNSNTRLEIFNKVAIKRLCDFCIDEIFDFCLVVKTPTQPNITLSWVRHENDLANRIITKEVEL